MYPITNLFFYGSRTWVSSRTRTLRPEPRERRVWCRVRRQRQGRAVALDRQAGAAAARQPAASRRVRLRGEHRRRRRHHHSDAGQVPAQRSAQSRHHAAAGRRVRRGLRVSAARSVGARDHRSAHRDRSFTKKGRRCSAGATCRPTIAWSARRRRRSSRISSRYSSARARSLPHARDRNTADPILRSSGSCTSSASASSMRSTGCRSRSPTGSISTSRACRRTR